MESRVPHRGGAPVGYLSELGPIEAGAIVYFRLWFDSDASRQQIQNDFETALGKDTGSRALQTIDAMFSLCTRHCRRPLMRHGVQCKCFGGDESCFANFIAYASEGQREDAMLMATHFVDPSVAHLLLTLAEDFASALRRMICFSHNIPKSKTLH